MFSPPGIKNYMGRDRHYGHLILNRCHDMIGLAHVLLALKIIDTKMYEKLEYVAFHEVDFA